ncbi:hypothetical protein Tco_0598749 [Tanacetum coccineum]
MDRYRGRSSPLLGRVQLFLDWISLGREEEKNDDMSKKVNLEDESDIEGVSETVFGDQDDPLEWINTGWDSGVYFPSWFFTCWTSYKDQRSPKDKSYQRVGDSILEVIDDMTRWVKLMGFTMEGSKKDLEKIIGSKAEKWSGHAKNKLFSVFCYGSNSVIVVIQATNIILQGLPPEVYALVSNHNVAKGTMESIQLLIERNL